MSEFGSALRIGRRVIVTGMAGAGKSTFARQLATVARHGGHAALHVLCSKDAIHEFLDHVTIS